MSVDVVLELVDQRLRVEETWHRRPPREFGECCAGWWYGEDDTAENLSQLTDEAMRAICHAAGLPDFPDGEPEQSVGRWNDEPERTKDEVMAVLEDAIAGVSHPAYEPWWSLTRFFAAGKSQETPL
jgi:hypothetical protein